MRTRIIHEDRDILVCHKPAGLAVESAAIGRMDMVSELKNYLKSPYLGIIHRLDQPVEGLLVFAKNQKAAAVLSRQLQHNTLNKEYYAAVCGKPSADAGTLVDYLQKNNKAHTSVVAEKGVPGSKEAILTYRILQTYLAEGTIVSLLHVQIKTGRFHQIRVQLAHAGTPILGDRKYGNATSLALSGSLDVKDTALCACSLEFTHPATGESLSFRITPDAGVFRLFDKIGKEKITTEISDLKSSNPPY